MIDHLISSATFGFGASFGRDLYQAAKKNPAVLVLIGIILVALGWRNIYLGVGHGLVYKFFVTLIGSLVMIILGSGAFMLAGSLFSGPDNNAPINIALIVIALSTLGGNIWGLIARRKRINAIQLEKHNAAFLNEIGISDSDFDTDLLQDREGNLLKINEETDSKIVFSVAGRRGLRAAIKLNNGRMVDYTGIIKI